MAPSTLTFAALSLLTTLPSAHAWGSLGHTTVAYIAQNLVSSRTARFAKSILQDKSDAYLATVATWPDSYRYEPGGEFSQVFHYIDAYDDPPYSCNVVFARDCPEEGCIVSALANYSSRVVMDNLDNQEKMNALKFIIHFLGDIHQPLHVEHYAIGGNQVNVTFNGAKTNLHAAWDTAIPQQAEGNFTMENSERWATELTREIKFGKYKKEAKSWDKGINVNKPIDSAMTWARDANRYVCETVMPEGGDVLFNKELNGTYYENAIPVVKKQIAKAGFRLAAWLDAVVENAQRGGHGKGHGKKEKHDKREDFELEPWMQEARQLRRDFGGDCGCTAEEHGH
ncbi:hypothetical protein M011DRAFT_471622 [Sporormia fimetaria CBS 119925]|uniref:S1/P1 nuclease n=1 Tax=Sporormia fimetaria CBS 119925 TaxID=1340428 RepID=A0A6A6UZB8_9PLEO|nr:hypothetical protein M011DRAFT_471622 [Sporormia fimetaria CBS 119925]